MESKNDQPIPEPEIDETEKTTGQLLAQVIEEQKKTNLLLESICRELRNASIHSSGIA